MVPGDAQGAAGVNLDANLNPNGAADRGPAMCIEDIDGQSKSTIGMPWPRNAKEPMVNPNPIHGPNGAADGDLDTRDAVANRHELGSQVAQKDLSQAPIP